MAPKVLFCNRLCTVFCLQSSNFGVLELNHRYLNRLRRCYSVTAYVLFFCRVALLKLIRLLEVCSVYSICMALICIFRAHFNSGFVLGDF